MLRTMDDFDILILPGWANAGPDHWQTQWQQAFPTLRRVEQDEWLKPVYADWAARLSEQVALCRKPAVLVAHSLGTSLVMKWAHEGPAGKVAGALLVAPSDRDSPTAAERSGFAPMVLKPLPFSSLVAASRNDPHVSLERARTFAQAWGSQFADVGALGHIGSDAKLGLWPQGLVLLGQLLAALEP
ncbi:alpha/beta hydrolase [Xanthobacter sp. VNH20]|uniref:RBBP9/YdeN family alpha/beta hydrolase n=1 Tax=Xanthobacter sp. VNH20 TaxID=3156616 RepID=UPI0032B57491